MKHLNKLVALSVSLALAFNTTAFCQVSNKINPDWTDDADWDGGNAPQYNTLGSGTLNHNSTITNPVTINSGHTITVNSGKTLSTNQSITVENGGQLTIIGTLNGTASGMEFKIEQGGTFTIEDGASVDWSGHVTIDGNLSVTTINDSLIIDGNFQITNSAVINGNGTIKVYGTLDNKGTIFGCNLPDAQCCSGAPCQLSGSALPIELMDFYATHYGNVVVLNWTTATEINNDYFDVERSSDKVNYIPVIRADGAGMSTTALYYTAEDKNPILYKTSYYRLKQTDFDGISSFSEVVYANYNSNDSLKIFIYPNPSIREKISILITGGYEEQEAEVILYDILGTIVFSEFVIIRERQNLTLNLANNPANGIYALMIKTGNKIYQQKLIITKQ